MTLKKLKKLRRMPPTELVGRAAGHWGIQRLKWLARTPDKWVGQVAELKREIVAACQALVPGTRPEQREQLAVEFPRQLETLSRDSQRIASAIVAGNYQLLGHPVRVDRPIDWHADPVSGHRWNDVFFSRVSYHQIPEHVDFKHVWELGRHQYLVELTRTAALNRNDSHLVLARQVLESWLSQNRFGHGIHWTSGLEVAIRAICWIWMIANAPELLEELPDPPCPLPLKAGGETTGNERDRSFAQRWLGQLALHGHYLENHLSIYSSPYNHVIGEATGLYLLGTVFRQSPHGERWRTKGRQLLHRFGPRQFYEDGFCVEQAVGYHYFTLGFLTMALVAGQATGDTELAVSELVRKGYRAGRLLRQPDGTWPAIGDVDSASAIPVARENFWDFSSLHQLAATALNEPEIGCVGESNFAETYWLLGASGLKRLRAMPIPDQPTQVAALPHAGYYIARNETDSIIFDAGPIAHGLHPDATPSVAHGHADTLQLLIQWSGQPIVRDSGMPNYAGNPRRCEHFRSPAAHSTISFDETTVVRHAGRLAWSHDIATTQLRWAEDVACWRACGSVQWDDCMIKRHVLAIPGEAVWIADWLESSRPQRAQWQWQLASNDWRRAKSDDRGAVFANSQMTIETTVGVEGLECKFMEPDAEGCVAWSSPGYGVLDKGAALWFQIPISRLALVLTVIGSPCRSVRFVAGGSEVRSFLTGGSKRMGRHVDESVAPSYDSLGVGTWYLHD